MAENKSEMQYMEHILIETVDINKYLDLLKIMSKHYLIVLSVRDTPGNMLTDEIIEKIHDIGFTDFCRELWRMYIGISNKGKIVCNALSEKEEEPVDYSCSIQETKISVSSMAWRKGNSCKILVNDKDYAINKRGINLVVYDTDNNRLVDSISYDAHASKDGVFIRFRKHDVGLFGLWYGHNYGSIITYFALHNVVKSLGYSTVMIKNPLGIGDDVDVDTLEKSHALRFALEHYDIAPLYRISEMNKLNDFCDKFLIGSDQMWRYNLSRPYQQSLFLDFVSDDKIKVAYASSFGTEKYEAPDDYKAKVGKNLHGFSAVSVRDDFSKEICEKEFGITAEQVIDPVFLCPTEKYEELVREADVKPIGNYFFSYILDPNPQWGRVIGDLTERTGKRAVVMFDGAKYSQKEIKTLNVDNSEGIEYLTEEDVCIWLSCFKNADFVVTDSFHGVCFSIIFHKPFIVKKNNIRGGRRFECLLGMVGLESQMVTEEEQVKEKFDDIILNDEIDYAVVDNRLEKEKKKGIEWLKNAFEMPKAMRSSGVIPETKMIDSFWRNTDFIKIRLLATLLRDYGVKHIVLSPGGRDVPLVRMFEYNENSFILHRVTDERSAAYYGMGIAAQLLQPVACVCTSGTAASNYLPAVTEAYYTGIPLIVITADRKEAFLNHGEDQTIPQKHIYDGVVKREITVPEREGYRAEYQTRRDISDCILEATHNGFGPVHINIAIADINMGAKISKEYWKLLPRISPHILRVSVSDGEAEMMRWVNELKKSTKILVVYGQNPPPTKKQLNNIEKFASKYNCAIVTDFISNLDCVYSLQSYNMLWAISNDEFNRKLSPDILITVGGKRLMNDPLTFKIRDGLKNIRHWSVTPNGKIKDFYFRLTSVLEMPQDFFFDWFSSHAGDIINNGVYYDTWKRMNEKYVAPTGSHFDSHYIQSKFIPAIPENSMLHLGVGQSFDSRRYCMNKNVEVFCNMGTNGIDGCTSTFMGQCSVIKDRLCFLLVGDLSFFYDMNSIWNKAPDKNVRILMVNNSGSSLLRGNNLKAVTAEHHTSARGWVEATNFKYMSANTKEEYEEKLKYFISGEPKEAVFFEVFCG